MLDQVSLDLEREPLSEADLALYCGRYCHAASYQSLLAAIGNGSSMVLTGPDGVGKGVLIHRLRQEAPPGIRFLECRNAPASLVELLLFLCDRLGLSSAAASDQQRVLADYLDQCQAQGSRLLLVLEQAEQLEPALLGDLLEWFARAPGELPQLLVSGSASLAERLMWIHSLDTQFLIHCHMTRLNDAETRDLLRWGLSYLGVDSERLSNKAMVSLVQQAQGLPGRAVALCEYASTLAEMDSEGDIIEDLLASASSELELVDDGEDINLPSAEWLMDDALLDDQPGIFDPATDAPEPVEPILSIDLQTAEPPPAESPVPTPIRVLPLPLTARRRRPLLAVSATVLLGALVSYGIYHQLLSRRLPPAEPARLVAELPEASPLAAAGELAAPLSPDTTVAQTPPAASSSPVPPTGEDVQSTDLLSSPLVNDVPSTPPSTLALPDEGARLVQADYQASLQDLPSSTVVAREVVDGAAEHTAPPAPLPDWTAQLPVLTTALQDWGGNLLASLDSAMAPATPPGVGSEPVGIDPGVVDIPSSIPVAGSGAADQGLSSAPREASGSSVHRPVTVAQLRAGGDRHLHHNDPAAARLFYERAAATGDPLAAMAVAMTYDPVVLQAEGLRWSYSDPDLATEWYLYAMQEGEPQAGIHLTALSDWLAENPLPQREKIPLPAEIPMENFQLVISAPPPHAYLRTGDRWLLRSDPVAARLLYRAAAASGSAVAAVAVAMTYDPLELASRGLTGAQADPLRALEWYRRARDLGAVGVETRIERLTRRPGSTTELADRRP